MKAASVLSFFGVAQWHKKKTGTWNFDGEVTWSDKASNGGSKRGEEGNELTQLSTEVSFDGHASKCPAARHTGLSSCGQHNAPSLP